MAAIRNCRTDTEKQDIEKSVQELD